MQKTITIACKGALELSLDQLNILQKDLKSLSHDDYQKYKKEILDTGFGFPIKVWQDDQKKWWIVGGTQGYRVLTEMHKEGFVIPKIPCSVINAKSKKEAYRRVLQDASSYGRMESDGLYEFLQLAEMSFDEFHKSFRTPEVNTKQFEDEFFKELDQIDSDPDLEESETGNNECPRCKFKW